MRKLVWLIAVLLLLVGAAAFAQKVLNIAAVDYPQFNAYTMRINASKKACQDFDRLGVIKLIQNQMLNAVGDRR